MIKLYYDSKVNTYRSLEQLWRSRLVGRGRMIGNHVNPQGFRGFESLLLRQRKRSICYQIERFLLVFCCFVLKKFWFRVVSKTTTPKFTPKAHFYKKIPSENFFWRNFFMPSFDLNCHSSSASGQRCPSSSGHWYGCIHSA